MSTTGHEWEVVVGFQNAMRELEALVVNVYMTDATKLEELRTPLEEVFNKIYNVGRQTVCNEPFPCRPPRYCCKDGFCKLICGIEPNPHKGKTGCGDPTPSSS